MADKFYKLDSILSRDAHYNVIFGMRSNGKTYACKEYGIKNYVKHGKQFAYIRRWDLDLQRGRGATLFDDMVANGFIDKITKHEWNNVTYKSRRWYFSRYEEDRLVLDNEPFAYAFSLSSAEHDKSTSYPNVTTIVFDEFLTRGDVCDDEFVRFTSVLSTIIRQRDDVKIFMLGNTVNKYSVYFEEMGLSNVRKMNPGDIDIYRYGESALTVAVEYADIPNKKKQKSNVYFAFQNPQLEMITSGKWEMQIYPHCPVKYKPKNILKSFFIEFFDDILQGDIVNVDSDIFVFIHQKTSEIKDRRRDLIYTNVESHQRNIFKGFGLNDSLIGKVIVDAFNHYRVFYQSNQIGEIVHSYIKATK